MKKLFSCLLSVAAVVGLASCSDAGDEYHSTYFDSIGLGGVEIYADQSEAHVNLVSLDTWTARVDAEWFSITPTEAYVPAGYQLTQDIKITTTPNTSGMVRSGAIRVQAFAEVATIVRQLPWLNIRRPVQYITKGETDSDPLQVRCEVTVGASATALPLDFTTYAPEATLQSDQPWITIEEPALKAGDHAISLTLEPNTVTEPREATLTLISGGVEAKIKVTQSGKVVE
ncbi:MAG: BACON domain-containing protein [Alloprevotella sp.]|nr:BACON domain-containing protein [Alloprevotella sp.]